MMTREELLSMAEIIERMVKRFEEQGAEHERMMGEHRISFGARTEADAKIIARLRSEVEASEGECNVLRPLVVDAANQVQDMRAEMERLREESVKHKAARDDLYQREGIEQKRRMDVEDERDALRAEVEMEVAALKSQTPQHPVKVGEWVRRLVPSPACDVGTVAKVVHVDDESEIEYDVKRIDGQHGVWFAKNCEPCDPPEATAKLAPKVGDTVRLVTHPEQAQVAKHLRTALQWPWMPSWGLVGQTGKVVKPLVAVAGAVAVALDGSTIFARWPIDCLEVVSEATHDTEAGKAAAESAVKTEPVADEIKIGNVVKVCSASGDNTARSDIGKIGEVIEIDSQDGTVLLSGGAGWVSRCDVRKVTT